MTDDKIKHMVDRFLGWRLPENFNPDAGISFQKTFNENTPYPMKHEPTGTNLFDASQAEEMIRYMLAEPAATEGTQEGQAMNLPQTGGVYIGLHEHQNVVPAEPSTPQTTELPPIEWTAGDRAIQKECGFDARGMFNKSLNQICRERQLSAALTQLAALRTSRDALLKDLNTFLDMEEFLPPLPIHQCGTEAMLYKAIIAIKARNILEANRAAAQQLQEDGK